MFLVCVLHQEKVVVRVVAVLWFFMQVFMRGLYAMSHIRKYFRISKKFNEFSSLLHLHFFFFFMLPAMSKLWVFFFFCFSLWGFQCILLHFGENLPSCSRV